MFFPVFGQEKRGIPLTKPNTDEIQNIKNYPLGFGKIFAFDFENRKKLALLSLS
jgi:hypothetical protein